MTAFAYQAIAPFSRSIFERGPKLLKESASQTFIRGAVLITEADGFVSEASADPTVVGFIAAEDGHDSAADGDTEVLAWPIEPDDEWYISLKEALAQNLIHTTTGNVGLLKDATTGHWTASTAETEDVLTITDFPKVPGEGVIGDTLTRVFAKFNAANIEQH